MTNLIASAAPIILNILLIGVLLLEKFNDQLVYYLSLLLHYQEYFS